MEFATPQFTVSQLSELLRTQLNDLFPNIRVIGEISGLTTSARGHTYFSLKDADNTLQVVMWSSTGKRIQSELREGDKIVAQGRVTVYGPRSQYQLEMRSFTPFGLGDLYQQFELLKKKLFEEGLFDPAHKRPLPFFIRKVAIITSPQGAALHDILETLRRYDLPLEVVIIPSLVQGAEAPMEIVSALQSTPQISPDVVLVSRGGGSLEDLWAFNDERVVRAIHACPFPVISGVGHEVDTTLADLVADIRAHTPTDAAERLMKHNAVVIEFCQEAPLILGDIMRSLLLEKRKELKALERILASYSPEIQIGKYRQNIDFLMDRAHRELLYHLRNLRSNLQSQQTEIIHRIQSNLTFWRSQLTQTTNAILLLDPNATMLRGYARCETLEGAQLIRSVRQVSQGDTIRVHLHDGAFLSRVESLD